MLQREYLQAREEMLRQGPGISPGTGGDAPGTGISPATGEEVAGRICLAASTSMSSCAGMHCSANVFVVETDVQCVCRGTAEVQCIVSWSCRQNLQCPTQSCVGVQEQDYKYCIEQLCRIALSSSPTTNALCVAA